MNEVKEKRLYLGTVKQDDVGSNGHAKKGKGNGIRERCGPTPPAKALHPIINEYLVKYRSPSIQENHH